MTPKNHDDLRDRLLLRLMAEGIEPKGAWEDWRLVPTGASQSQIWGSERTEGIDRRFAWTLEYNGLDEAARQQSNDLELGSRYPVPQCALQVTAIKALKHKAFHDSKSWHQHHVGFEFYPTGEQPGEDVGPEYGKEEMPGAGLRKRSVITYVCEVCGKEFTTGRRYKYPQEHVKDGGALRFLKAEKV